MFFSFGETLWSPCISGCGRLFQAPLGSGVVVAPESISASPGGWMAGAVCYIVIDRFPGRLVSAYIPCLLLSEECYAVMNVGEKGSWLGMMHRTIEALHHGRRRDLWSVTGSPWGGSVELSFSPSNPNGVCFASFHRVGAYQ